MEPIEIYTAVYTLFTAGLFFIALSQLKRSNKQHRTLIEYQIMSELETFTSKNAEYLNQIMYNHRHNFQDNKPLYSNTISQAMTVFLQTLDNRITRSFEKKDYSDVKEYLRKQYWVQLHPEHRVRLKLIFGDYLNSLSGKEAFYQLLIALKSDFKGFFEDY